jgi:membrane fusion protein (multidrug efflux system)
VKAGQVLARLYESQEAAELAQIEQEFTLQLINRLRDPNDASAEQALLSLRTQRELARSRLQERTLRAPQSGRVSDVRVRPGQYLQPGQLAVSIGHEEARPTLVVLVPGQYRPSIKPGLPIRLEIAGYKYAYQKLAVESVSDEVIGPTEARRYLGPEIADSVAIDGPVAIVKARLPAAEFTADGKTYRYHNGMHGTAEVQVRSERLLLTLVPGLKALFHGKGDLL